MKNILTSDCHRLPTNSEIREVANKNKKQIYVAYRCPSIHAMFLHCLHKNLNQFNAIDMFI